MRGYVFGIAALVPMLVVVLTFFVPTCYALASWNDEALSSSLAASDIIPDSSPDATDLVLTGEIPNRWSGEVAQNIHILNEEMAQYPAHWTLHIQGNYIRPSGERDVLFQVMVPDATPDIRPWLNEVLAPLELDDATLDRLATDSRSTSNGQFHQVVVGRLDVEVPNHATSPAGQLNNAATIEWLHGDRNWKVDVRIPVWQFSLNDVDFQANGVGLAQASIPGRFSDDSEVMQHLEGVLERQGLPGPKEAAVTNYGDGFCFERPPFR